MLDVGKSLMLTREALLTGTDNFTHEAINAPLDAISIKTEDQPQNPNEWVVMP